MMKRLNIADNQVSSKVIELQRESYKVEAEIIGFDKIPPLIETEEKLMKCEEVFYGYYKEDDLVGIISYKIKKGILDIHRVAVSPKHFRMGIAQQLIKFIEVLEKGATKIIVSTGALNIPAINLYKKLGYKEVKTITAEDSVNIICLEKITEVTD